MQNKTPGLLFVGGQWVVDKRVKGFGRVYERTGYGKGEREQAEARYRQLIEAAKEQVRREEHGIVVFREAAAKYLLAYRHKRSIERDAQCLVNWDPFVGVLEIDRIHMGSLQAGIDARKAAGIKSSTVRRELAVIRRILTLCARSWRHDHNGKPYLLTAPPLIDMPDWEDGDEPYPLTWPEQAALLKALPDHLATAALFGLHTGARESAICGLRWDWELEISGVKVFIAPGRPVVYGEGDKWKGNKNKRDNLFVLNGVATSIVEAQRGKHESRVFTFRDRPFDRMNSSAWRKAWERAGLPAAGVKHGPHNLRHTFAQRLRSLDIPRETRKALMNHADGDISELYAPAQIKELAAAVEKLVSGSAAATVLRAVGR